jgi:hypothetical protein
MNLKKSIFAFCGLGLLCFITCENNIVDISAVTPLDGTFIYTAYDSLDIMVAQGILTFEFQDSTNITGEWEINKVGDPKSIGPQIGEGKLVGASNDKTLWASLNPDIVDDNVFLHGRPGKNKYTGKWEWITERGITNWGTFKAEKEMRKK